MRGEVLDFDPATLTGRISDDDGARYGFVSASLQAGAHVRPGQRVDFVADGESATQIVTLAATPAPAPERSYANPSAQAQPFEFQTALFSFEGRLRRQNFWISWLILLSVGVVLGWIPVLGTLISMGLIWPNLAITVTRLHDMGRSGWLAVIPYAVAIIGTIVGVGVIGIGAIANSAALEREDPMAILGIIGPVFGLFAIISLVCLGFLLWIGVTDSQPGSNRFGPNPKNPIESDVFA